MPDDKKKITPAAVVPASGGTDPDATRIEDRTRPRARPAARAEPLGSETVVGPSASAFPRSPAGESTTPGRPRPVRPSGAIPEAPPSAPTRTQRVVAGLQREWKVTAAAAGGCVAIGVVSLWLWSNDHQVFAILVALIVFPVAFAALFVRRAPCPRCGHPVLLVGIDRCPNCHDWIRVDGNQIKPVEVGFVADSAVFDLDIPIPILPRLEFPPGGCCVCGGPPAIDETLEVQGTTFVIPHCGSHEHGVTWSLGMVGTAIPMVTFGFRSFDYWKGFQQLNRAHVKEGMWR